MPRCFQQSDEMTSRQRVPAVWDAAGRAGASYPEQSAGEHWCFQHHVHGKPSVHVNASMSTEICSCAVPHLISCSGGMQGHPVAPDLRLPSHWVIFSLPFPPLPGTPSLWALKPAAAQSQAHALPPLP